MKISVENAKLENKNVLVRCDFNVPFDENGEISDTRRIDESFNTINFLMEKGAKIILCSHLGRPHGVISHNFSLKRIVKYLSKRISKDVKISDDVVGESSKRIVSELSSGDVCLLENLRFEIGEENNDVNFAKKLASFADIYVNDAFGTSHREHASLVSVPKFLPSYCGFLIQKEIKMISNIVDNPRRPFVSILGGAKVSDKIDVIKNLIDKVDIFIIGGGMTYTFMNALGYSIGDSICEKSKLSVACDILSFAKEKGTKLLLPVDCKLGKEYAADTESIIVDSDKIPDCWQGLDIGPKTIEIFCNELENAGSVVWNGPMGVSEWENFSYGTYSLAKVLAKSSADTVVGGGDVAAAVNKFGFSSDMYHISTGGGASLMFLGGKDLPGITALHNSNVAEVF